MDMAIGAGVATAFFTYTLWLENGTLRRSIFFGIGIALALLSKFSSVLLLPVGILVITGINWPGPGRKRNWAFIAVAFVLIWAAYRFSFGPMTEHVSRDAAEQGGVIAKIPPSILHLVETVPVPAPQILDGLWQVHNHVDAGHTAFLSANTVSAGGISSSSPSSRRPSPPPPRNARRLPPSAENAASGLFSPPPSSP